MSYNCEHGIEAAFHCFDCEAAFKRTGQLHDEFKTWEFTWSKINGRSPTAEDGWLSDRYRKCTTNLDACLCETCIEHRTCYAVAPMTAIYNARTATFDLLEFPVGVRPGDGEKVRILLIASQS